MHAFAFIGKAPGKWCCSPHTLLPEGRVGPHPTLPGPHPPDAHPGQRSKLGSMGASA